MILTPNQRICWNVVATYGRSLYTMLLGLFTARWALQALGQLDFGLFGLVGGMTSFIVFLNSLLSVSTSRFFAYEVGQKQIVKNKEFQLKECQLWFTSAIIIHVLMAVILVIVGYPIGLYVVKNYLVIPEIRIEACMKVWLITCIMCFVGMISVPFKAMYTAKQEIVEMTFYPIITTTLNACFLYYAATNEGDWLVYYAIAISSFTVIPQIIMCVRAFAKFEECRFTYVGVSFFQRLKSMFSYSVAQFFADFAGMVSTQGVSIVINKALGPLSNAALSIGNRVADQALALGTAMIGAFNPAIVNAAGAKNLELMRHLSYLTCKFGSLVVLFFAIPLMLESKTVLIIWLKTPPEGASILCSLALVSFVVNRLSSGLSSSVEALGKIAMFKISMGIAGLLPLGLTIIFLSFGCGLKSVGVATLFTTIPFTLIRLYFSSRFAGINPVYWFKSIFFPVIIVSLLGSLVALPFFIFMESGFLRIVIVTLVSCITIGISSWGIAFSSEERLYVISKISRIFNKKTKRSINV